MSQSGKSNTCQSELHHVGNYRKKMLIMTLCFIFLVHCQTSMIAYMVIMEHLDVLELSQAAQRSACFQSRPIREWTGMFEGSSWKEKADHLTRRATGFDLKSLQSIFEPGPVQNTIFSIWPPMLNPVNSSLLRFKHFDLLHSMQIQSSCQLDLGSQCALNDHIQ